MQSSRLVRAVFAALVIVTIGTFFATQRLKTEVPVVLRFAANPRHISPNDDRVRDRTRVGFDLHDAATISFGIVNSDGDQVRSIVRDRRLPADSHDRFTWDGRDDAGHVVPDGSYRMRVTRKDRGRTLDSIKKVIVDTKRPKVTIAPVTPDVLSPGIAGTPQRVRIRYRGPINAAPEFRIWHTDVDGPPRIARRFRSIDGRTGTWDGRVRGGPTPDGSYAVTVLVRDKAGNLTEAPAGQRLPTARAARPGTGIVVERLSLRGPSMPVAPGSVARLTVGPAARRVRYALYRLGSAAPLRSGVRRAGSLRIGVPAGARTGVYVVRVRAGGRRAEWPLVVRARASAGRPLVVLPVATWQGTNRYDSDRDGFPDTLTAGHAIPIDRPYALGRLPTGLRRETAPLLEFLDRARLRYDLTTDVALARSVGPKLADAPGVAVAGTETWVPRQLRDGLREQTERGGLHVVSFGRESLRRTVAVVDGRLRDPSPARPDDLFGERTRLQRIGEPAPLEEERDRLRLFADVDRVFGEFSLLERSEGVPTGGRLLTAAGRRPGGPAFVGYRLGKGLVIRPGTPQWTSQLSENSLGLEVPRITRAIWRQLARPR